MKRCSYDKNEKVGKTQKKRLHYNRISIEKKRDLVFRSIFLHEPVRVICKELELNFLSGRNLVQKYKKTGNYGEEEHIVSENMSAIPTPTPGIDAMEVGMMEFCSLSLGFNEDERLVLISSKRYHPEEGENIEKLHQYFENIKGF